MMSAATDVNKHDNNRKYKIEFCIDAEVPQPSFQLMYQAFRTSRSCTEREDIGCSPPLHFTA